ncbi:hypothetical protein TTHERM_00137940 (macronuclear) [Tetrahymena thermophila SB210]|uniref:Uncharacterized protein n=1 Tax=Tetrahymena thermophila (strain SB210) TaxID=312017 RepID=I7LVQ7_TETTS|nr:hypothetical protein TTHERM_00137940 [Tetrahymena thermophila SB210]EAR99531.4 hypothetical protein TTHERM_00137940 [Tetrahymena thermophila SB210]|eukprot:XP_001019776.4 hypothetical protein TTHERM_00137940 [Tetrahymena thermophila SB210]
MNFIQFNNQIPKVSDNYHQNYQKDILTNQYLCFNEECEASDLNQRMCYQQHPAYVLPKSQIKTQLAKFNTNHSQYDSMMGILYQTISLIQELQKILEVFHYIPKLQEDSVEYQQKMFHKLKSHFELISNFEKLWLVIKNQNQLFFQTEIFINQIKEQVYKFECQYFCYRQMTIQQGQQYLELNKQFLIDNNNSKNNKQMHQKQNDIQNCIQINDDQSSGDDIQIIEQSNFKQYLGEEEEAEGSNQNHVLIEINSQNQSRDDQVVELSSGEDNIQMHVQDFRSTYQFHNMIDEKLDQQQKYNKFLNNQQNCSQQIIISTNSNLAGQTSNEAQNDQAIKNQTQHIQNKKIKKSKKETIKEGGASSSQDKNQKQRKKRITKEQKILELQKKLQGNLSETKQNSQTLSDQDLQKQNQSAQTTLNIKSIIIPLNFKKSGNSVNNSLLTTSDETIKNNISQTININQQQNFDSSKTTQLMTTSSESSNLNEKVIEDDDELEQELQIIKNQHGSVEKLMVTQYSWQKQSSEKRKSFDSNQEEEYSRISQMNQLKIPMQGENSEIVVGKNENYLAQFKVIYFKNKKALLALNQKNLVLYTFQKPKSRKQPQYDQYNIDSEEEIQESKSQQEIDYNFLHKKKILYNNIKSAEIFEIYGSYFVLVMFETNGFVSVVKSNNLIKWKPYYKSVEPSISANYYIFNNSTTLQMILFYSSQIKLVQLDINSSKPNAKQANSKFLQQSLLEGSFSTACQGIWQVKRDQNQTVECKYNLYFTILQDNYLSIFKYDTQKIDILAREYLQNVQFCKLLKINDEVNIVAIIENEIQLYDLQIKLHTRIQAKPEFGSVIDVSLPSNQIQNEQYILIIQEKGSFLYNFKKNKTNILKLPEKYNSIFHSQNLQSLVTLNEQENGSFQINLNSVNQIQI